MRPSGITPAWSPIPACGRTDTWFGAPTAARSLPRPCGSVPRPPEPAKSRRSSASTPRRSSSKPDAHGTTSPLFRPPERSDGPRLRQEEIMNDVVDVVVVGGGIAGGAIASMLAARRLDIVVLERQHSFRDRVRGENMQPWGVVEMVRLGLEDVLVGAGGGYCDRVVLYDENTSAADAEATALPLG